VSFLDYPEREPMGAMGAACHQRSIELAALAPAGRSYSYGTSPFQRVLVHAAPEPSGDVLLAFHGGGWTHGYKEWMSMMAPPLNRRGISLVTAGYRLAPEHVFPAGLEDCEAALAWLGKHLDAIGAHADRVFVTGHSAGGHYASLLALRPARPGRVPIAGCLPISGVYEFGEGAGLAQRPRFLGPEPSREVDVAASPLHQTLKGAPPFFITWGERDFPHLITQAQRMVLELRQADVPVRTLELPGADHFEACYASAEMDGAWIRGATAFMREVVPVT
jgi:acetyl esterase/lipase